MAKKKSTRRAGKGMQVASRKMAKKPAAQRGRKSTARRAATARSMRGVRRGGAKKAAARGRKTAARGGKTRKVVKKTTRMMPPAPRPARKSAMPKAAPRPKRPRRTKQALPPEPRTIPTPVVDVQPIAPAAPAAPPMTPVEPTMSETGSQAGFGAIPSAETGGGIAGPNLNAGGPAPLGGGASAGPALEVGDLAPAFELPDEKGQMHRLVDYRGRKVVLYFYPKDDTPGCTAEACGFRDRHGDFTDRGAVVLGVSADSSESHQRFIQKHGLNFPLLADTDHQVAEEYGAWVQKQRAGVPYMGIARTTFVIDSAGGIVHIFRNVKPEEHEAEVLGVL